LRRYFFAVIFLASKNIAEDNRRQKKGLEDKKKNPLKVKNFFAHAALPFVNTLTCPWLSNKVGGIMLAPKTGWALNANTHQQDGAHHTNPFSMCKSSPSRALFNSKHCW
jgi:hypothetical protein